jgi:hypothetical protein
MDMVMDLIASGAAVVMILVAATRSFRSSSTISPEAGTGDR